MFVASLQTQNCDKYVTHHSHTVHCESRLIGGQRGCRDFMIDLWQQISIIKQFKCISKGTLLHRQIFILRSTSPVFKFTSKLLFLDASRSSRKDDLQEMLLLDLATGDGEGLHANGEGYFDPKYEPLSTYPSSTDGRKDGTVWTCALKDLVSDADSVRPLEITRS